ncbi:DNA repair protein RadB [Candidatus Caldarchaeum subterraneum]|uniref:DNA repair protein RadB n=1 Tax=Caldiarchaeum subterraneum TaxID=311458 RepID=E6N3T0_CALS0|nr:DNA repair protein RadB [Candidatus Caldarchaeum subterraneum]BAJ50549.1 DNA repair protein RadB [Candidatus Caldarchaeum subterraneum]
MTAAGIRDFFTADFKPTASYLLYGEEKSGKTALLLTAAAKIAEKGGKVVWIDCGARLHPARLRQIFPVERLSQLYISQPRTFREQFETLLNVHDFPPSDASLIVCDDFTYLHKLELSGKPSTDLPVYRALSLQAALLKNLAIARKISVVLVGLVHSIPAIDAQEPVAARIVTYWSDVVAKVQKGRDASVVMQEKPVAQKIYFKIVEKGVEVLRF